MRARVRTQYLFRNTAVRTQRSRIEPLNNQTPNAMDWSNILTPVDEEGTTGFVQAVGFTANTTLLVSVPNNVLFADDGTLTVITSPNADPANIKYAGNIIVAAIGTAVTPFPVSPGDYIAFYATGASPTGPITVTVTDKPTARTIDTFTITISI